MRVPGGVCSAGVQGGLRMCVESSGQCPYQTKGQHQSPVPNRPNGGDICIKFYTARGKTVFLDPRVPAVLAAKLPVLETLLGVDMPLSVATRILEAALAGELAGDDKHVRGHVEAVKDKADTEYTSPFKKIRVASNNEESLEIVNAVNDLIVRVVDLEGRCSGGDSTAGASLGASVSHVKESLDALKLSLTSQVSGLSVQTNRASALAYASHQVANQAQSGVSSLQALGINASIPQEVKDRLALLERQHTETSGILGEAVKLLQLQAVKLNKATGPGGGTLGVSHSDSTDLRASVKLLSFRLARSSRRWMAASSTLVELSSLLRRRRTRGQRLTCQRALIPPSLRLWVYYKHVEILLLQVPRAGSLTFTRLRSTSPHWSPT